VTHYFIVVSHHSEVSDIEYNFAFRLTLETNLNGHYYCIKQIASLP